MPLEIAHLSDLHVSRYGEHVTSLQPKLRSRVGKGEEDWEPLAEVDGWAVEKRIPRRRWGAREPVEDAVELRLLDDEGYLHVRRKGKPTEVQAMQADLVALSEERHLTHHGRLAKRFPAPERVEELLAEDPTNTNLLFCRAAWVVREARPDWVLVTGDLTDDGIGYDLIEEGLRPFIEAGRLLAIPGNHDVYGSPPFVVPPHERKDVAEKRKLWAPFAHCLGLPAEGTWVRELGEGVVVCAVDSCTPTWTPLSASGEVRREALDALAEELSGYGPTRLAMLHHHVVNPPILPVGRAPWQLGMRLRNAREVYDFFLQHRFAAVLNGHRHVGYRYHPSFAPMFISAPSTTLGCRTGAPTYFWQLEIRDGELCAVREHLLSRPR